MRKTSLLAVFAVALLVGTFFVASMSNATKPPHKVTLCHMAKKGEKQVVIRPDIASVLTHLDHGDCILDDPDGLVTPELLALAGYPPDYDPHCTNGECGSVPSEEPGGPGL